MVHYASIKEGVDLSINNKYSKVNDITEIYVIERLLFMWFVYNKDNVSLISILNEINISSIILIIKVLGNPTLKDIYKSVGATPTLLLIMLNDFCDPHR